MGVNPRFLNHQDVVVFLGEQLKQDRLASVAVELKERQLIWYVGFIAAQVVRNVRWWWRGSRCWWCELSMIHWEVSVGGG